MIGIIILIFAVGIYISGNKKWSTLIYLGMLNNGFQVLTDRVIGIKNLDIAFIYMVIICIYSQIYEKPPKVEYGIKKHVYWLFAFMVCSVLFSYIHYGFTFAQILQGSRHLWFFMSYLFLRKLRYKDVIWIFEKLYYITLIVSVLYIIQVIFRLPTLPYYDLEYVKNIASYGCFIGLDRLYKNTSEEYVSKKTQSILELCKASYEDQILLSHDALFFNGFEAELKIYEQPRLSYCFDYILPQLPKSLSDKLMVQNPMRMLSCK